MHNRPIILIGKSGSGKTTVTNYLVDNYDYKQITTYTSRPRRECEAVDAYHFISNEKFNELKNKAFFAEFYKKVLNDGKLIQYGSAKSDYENFNSQNIIILTPNGMRNAVNALGISNVSVIYLKVSENILNERLNFRNSESETNYKSRLNREHIDFDGIEPECDFVINGDNLSVETIAELIQNYCFDNLY